MSTIVWCVIGVLCLPFAIIAAYGIIDLYILAWEALTNSVVKLLRGRKS